MLRRALLAAALTAACTTSFDPSQLRSSDAGAVPEVSTDVSTDVPADVPSVDVTVDGGPACGASGLPCCEVDGGPRCGASLVCSQGACVPCPSGLTPCGDLCVDPAVSVAHCGGCSNRCPDGQECQGGSCRLNCPAPLIACDGRCVLVSTDVSHCGACGEVCPATAGTPRCSGGACVTDCATNRGDCDGNASNGCEADLAASTDHCGACGRRCAFANATPTCTDGACRLDTCAAGYGDCDGDTSDGCETSLGSSAAHCGACGRACAAGQVCRDGACAATTVTCAAGRGNCDGDDANRCEVDLDSSTAHCGGCGRACAPPNATPRCVMGACAVRDCAGSYANCDGSQANGCETDTRSSLNHCGACGARCAFDNASATCAAGDCNFVACAAGYGDCDRDLSNGCETSLRDSLAHCGGCGAACNPANAAGACVMGACRVASCAAGFADCDGNPGNGCEVDTRSSAASCGACGRLCALPHATATCEAGACAITECARGYGDCDGDASNGCETPLDTTSNCGGCRRRCALSGVPTVACCVGATAREVRCCPLNCNSGPLLCAAPVSS